VALAYGMVVDILKKLKGEARARQQKGDEKTAAPKHESAHRFFVSNNWKALCSKRPDVAPKAAAALVHKAADGGATADVVALDCEMVGVGPSGVRSALARVSIVDFEGNVLMDKFVRPNEKVEDYRTHITGINAATLRRPDVLSEDVARRRTAEILDGKIVVGHSIQNDFQALLLSHPHSLIRDTSVFKPLRPPGRETRTPSLAKLSEVWLHQSIHDGVHDSIEDARVALRLYRLKSRLWEKQMRSAMRHGPMQGAEADAENEDVGESIGRDEGTSTSTRSKVQKRKKKTAGSQTQVSSKKQQLGSVDTKEGAGTKEVRGKKRKRNRKKM